jgi:hypothetical protein
MVSLLANNSHAPYKPLEDTALQPAWFQNSRRRVCRHYWSFMRRLLDVFAPSGVIHRLYPALDTHGFSLQSLILHSRRELTSDSNRDNIHKYVNELEPIHSNPPMSPVQELRGLPSPWRQQDKAIFPATGPGAPLFLYELQQPVLRLPIQ